MIPKQWWSVRSLFVAQAVCLLAVFAWSVHHSPAEATAAAPVVHKEVIDNSDKESVDAERAVSETNARFIAPPTVPFRTEHPPGGGLRLRSLDLETSNPEENSERWEPVQPQNPPRRPAVREPRSPFEPGGATVYYAPLAH